MPRRRRGNSRDMTHPLVRACLRTNGLGCAEATGADHSPAPRPFAASTPSVAGSRRGNVPRLLPIRGNWSGSRGQVGGEPPVPRRGRCPKRRAQKTSLIAARGKAPHASQTTRGPGSTSGTGASWAGGGGGAPHAVGTALPASAHAVPGAGGATRSVRPVRPRTPRDGLTCHRAKVCQSAGGSSGRHRSTQPPSTPS